MGPKSDVLFAAQTIKVIERLNQEFCNAIRTKYPGEEDRVRRMSIIEEGKVKMSHLAIVGSHKINGLRLFIVKF